MNNIGIKLDNPKAMPLRAHPNDAGADLFSVGKHIIYPNEICTVDTGVSVSIPDGYAGFVCSRSGQGKLRISLSNSVGIIDSAYRGNIKVMIVNEGDDPYEINPYATKVAQLIIVPVMLANFVEYIGSTEDWLDTSRGVSGFGSTGG